MMLSSGPRTDLRTKHYRKKKFDFCSFFPAVATTEAADVSLILILFSTDAFPVSNLKPVPHISTD